MKKSKRQYALEGTLAVAILLITAGNSPQAEESRGMISSPLAPHPSMTENKDGNIKPGEYEVISTNGSITRALCPYTCEARGLPKESCRTWPSKREPDKCYVQDTRLPSEAVPLDK